jgi:hypothetical protein
LDVTRLLTVNTLGYSWVVTLCASALFGCAEGFGGPTESGGAGASTTSTSSVGEGGSGVGGGGDGGSGVGGGGDGGSGAGPSCGDGVVDANEECDGLALGSGTCLTLGFVGGELACASDCSYDTSGCLETLCGNAALDDGEECDGDLLGVNTCSSLGFAGGPLVCDASCALDDTGCKPNFSTGFEMGMPVAFTQTGNAAWSTQTTTYYAGTAAARSGTIGNSQSTGMAITLSFEAAGQLSFWHRVSSESGFDYLRFYIDGVQQSQWSGTTSWAQSSYAVSAGSHSFEWRYTKDSSLSLGSDTAWVDDIAVTGGFLP